jgi:hypothetical protein
VPRVDIGRFGEGHSKVNPHVPQKVPWIQRAGYEEESTGKSFAHAYQELLGLVVWPPMLDPLIDASGKQEACQHLGPRGGSRFDKITDAYQKFNTRLHDGGTSGPEGRVTSNPFLGRNLILIHAVHPSSIVFFNYLPVNAC